MAEVYLHIEETHIKHIVKHLAAAVVSQMTLFKPFQGSLCCSLDRETAKGATEKQPHLELGCNQEGSWLVFSKTYTRRLAFNVYRKIRHNLKV